MTHKRLKEAPGTRAPEVRVSPYRLVASRAGFKGDRDRQLLSPTPHARPACHPGPRRHLVQPSAIQHGCQLVEAGLRRV